MKKHGTAYYKSDIGIIEINGTDGGITSIEFFHGDARSIIDEDSAVFFEEGKVPLPDALIKDAGSQLPACVFECISQLDEYFRGTRKAFELKLYLSGTDFQKRVWSRISQIPYGQTATYSEVAADTGNEKAFRAAGGASNKNRVPIIIPCHRVVGNGGALTGYAGGIWRKEWLLAHEKKHCIS
ncbi:MAG: methylated-DNA--[protein]-cysteine S-methyltransferase [Clostridiales bacterium]|nr:methylated-DNA--[protein]-cysteine S-methyltransferase [Clostridiales bacterium]